MKRLALLLALILPACGPPAIAGDVEVWVVAREEGAYDLARRTIEVEDLHSLEGATTTFWSRGRLALTQMDPPTLGVVRGHPFSLRAERSEGAFLALDFDGLMALTIYHHLGAAHRYFQDLGLGRAVEDLPLLTTHFLPTVELLGLPLPLLTDNAGYAPALGAFLIFDQAILDEVPLGANEGVITHEFGHAVFHHLASRVRGEPLPAWMDGTWPLEPSNTLRSIDEGLADVHGAALTGDPNFIAPSATELQLDRDVSAERVWTAELGVNLSLPLESYDPYALGSVIASAFWDHGRRLEARGHSPEAARRALALAAFETARTLRVDASITLLRFLEDAASAVPDEDRGDFCAALGEVFAELGEVPGCV